MALSIIFISFLCVLLLAFDLVSCGTRASDNNKNASDAQRFIGPRRENQSPGVRQHGREQIKVFDQKMAEGNHEDEQTWGAKEEAQEDGKEEEAK